MNIVISCEHAGREVPDKYLEYFSLHQAVLESHRGWDAGAWEVARYMSERLGVPCFGCQTTRLLIEVNRSLHHPQLFSEFVAHLSAQERDELIQTVYWPYRKSVEDMIENSKQPVLHLSVHSFTPILNGLKRNLEIGLLFDPDRSEEVSVCEDFKTKLAKSLPGYRIKFNEPYKGTDDGFTTYLRTKFVNDHYRGIEIEINQGLIETLEWTSLQIALADCATTYKLPS